MGPHKVMARHDGASLVDLDATGFDALSCCGIKNPAHPGRQEKRCWLAENARFGLRAKAVVTPDGKALGYIEYVPGEFAWRGVNAAGYMFIHCIWMHLRQHQRKGWGGQLLQACVSDAQKACMSGVAAMVRDGPWMAGRSLFLANGFEVVDTAPPDYELLARRFDPKTASPSLRQTDNRSFERHSRGLTIVRSSQCPHIAKFAAEIAESARTEYRIEPRVITLRSSGDAQNAPTPYAVFSVIYNGKVVADHQIIRTRFRNIMNKLLR